MFATHLNFDEIWDSDDAEGKFRSEVDAGTGLLLSLFPHLPLQELVLEDNEPMPVLILAQ